MLQELTFGTFDAQVLNSSRPVVVDFGRQVVGLVDCRRAY